MCYLLLAAEILTSRDFLGARKEEENHMFYHFFEH